jgi:hypothetical protein
VLLDDPRDIFAIEIPARHHHDSASSPEPAGRKDFAMPEGIYEPFA